MKALLSLSAALLFTSASQAAIVLSNTDTGPGRQVLTRDLSPLEWHATPIRTGSDEVILQSIVAEIQDFFPVGTLFMEIWTVDGLARPGSTLATLNLTTDTIGEKTFTGAVPLSADSSYFIVTGVANGGGQWREATNFADPFGQDFNVDSGSWTLSTQFGGGSVTQSYTSTNQGGTWSSDGATGAPLRMTIDADVVPEPSSALLGMLGAFLLGWRRRR